MFQKVLIVEDHNLTHVGIKDAIQSLEIPTIEYAKYCDEAHLKIHRALQDKNPYDLLITDLSFLPLTDAYKIKSGEELIQILNKEKIALKIIVFSTQYKTLPIKKLFDDYHIDGFVSKSHHPNELSNAIRKIYNGEQYKSPEIERNIHLEKNNYVLDDADFLIMKLLCEGYSQKEIANHFLKNNIVPSSKSSIEKKINMLKQEFQAKSNIELVIILQKLGLLNE